MLSYRYSTVRALCCTGFLRFDEQIARYRNVVEFSCLFFQRPERPCTPHNTLSRSIRKQVTTFHNDSKSILTFSCDNLSKFQIIGLFYGGQVVRTSVSKCILICTIYNNYVVMLCNMCKWIRPKKITICFAVLSHDIISV